MVLSLDRDFFSFLSRMVITTGSSYSVVLRAACSNADCLIDNGGLKTARIMQISLQSPLELHSRYLGQATWNDCGIIFAVCYRRFRV